MCAHTLKGQKFTHFAGEFDWMRRVGPTLRALALNPDWTEACPVVEIGAGQVFNLFIYI